MAFVDVINDYSAGATGTLTDAGGDSVGYLVSGTSPTVDWNSLDDGARVNANGTEYFTVTFDEPVVGAMIEMSGSDTDEIYFIEVDGVTVDLNTLIANGDVTFSQTGASTHVIDPDGGISGGHYNDGSIAYLVFNIPVTSLGVYGTNGTSSNWDYFEVGIDDTTFQVICFSEGTLIETDAGYVPIESLTVGDKIRTIDSTYRSLRWIGSQRIGKNKLFQNNKLFPVRITAGALGGGLPRRDLLVSRQHRVLISSRIAKRMFGANEVLIPAIKLVDYPGIYVDDTVDDVTYFHLLFDSHEVIFAEGTPAESLYTGAEALKSVSRASYEEIISIFPELVAGHPKPPLARYVPTGKLQKQLVSRHVKNKKPLLEQHV